MEQERSLNQSFVIIKSKLWKSFKENTATLLAIPTILGGFWQLISLGNISVGCIRFFSITQLLSDGIIVSFVIGIYYLFYLMLKKFDANNWGARVIVSATKKENRLKYLVYYSAMALVFSYLFVLGYPNMNDEYNFVSFCLLVLGVYFIYGFIKSIRAIIIISIRYYAKQENRQKYYNQSDLLILIGIIYSAYFMFHILSTFNTHFLIPRNSENYTALIRNLRKDCCNCAIELKYMNDEYIFLNKHIANNDTLIILKTDAFFNVNGEQNKN